MAKQVKSVENLDRISGLSDPILCHILSFLPIKVAVRTSVLSSRWRDIFDSMPILDFQYCFSDVSSRLDAEKFKNFVDRLLFFPNHVSLECFRLYESSSLHDNCLRLNGRIYGWICAALWRGVKEIDLRYETSTVLPTFLFTSRSLVTLKLDINAAMKVPSKVCLPNLKSLHLKHRIFLDDGSIHRLISGCLALEDLVMDLPKLPKNPSKLSIHSLSLKRLDLECSYSTMLTVFPLDFNYTFVINTPNLVDFKYVGPITEGYCLRTMNSLEKADVSLESGTTATISNLLQGICDAKSLHLTIEQPEMLREPPEPLLEFHKLVELELKILKEYGDWQGTWVIRFLDCTPVLETLHLDLPVPHRRFKPLPLPEEEPLCLLLDLKEIKIRYFDGNEHMFELISYFLNHASVLETLMIGIEKDDELSIMKKLLELPRNSKKCQILAL